ncbi:MAG: DNA repair protein RecN [uncultured Thermomicrobiales bacterium]|uniref:DNA repair protein RecN n=1 Tax=uncultured Thermomicrobiales bacterium TaxID=1645740 RepID=A0A6J4V4Y6_9BACT|nr:MAG: DNA repair protein RecN [uncultured Thermomicrobiales bacterium]
MLQELSIVDFAIIDRAVMQFGPGMNVITGETGAGKSILLDALAAVLGSRVSTDLVRTGAKSTRVEAVFFVGDTPLNELVQALDDAGIDLDDEKVLIFAREIQSTGRSIARINGRTTTAGQLAAIGEMLVDIHGQSDHLAILRSTEQRSLLDRYARVEGDRREVARLARRLRDVRSKLESLASDSRERERRLDLLRFQAEEIETAELVAGEDVALTQERDVLLNADRLRDDAARAAMALSGDDALDVDGNAASRLRTVEKAIADLAGIDPTSSALHERATELVVLCEELGRELRDYLDRIEADPARLAEVEDRLSLIQGLKRKYGATIAEIVAFGDSARAEIEEATSGAQSLEALEADASSTEEFLVVAAATLSRKRTMCATALAREIERSIAELKMGRASVEIAVRRRADPAGIGWDVAGEPATVHFDESGVDDIEFLIAPNAGEALKPLARIASGGETARIMLALKSILSEIDSTPTLVFDEIDVGVGGRSGQVVGQKLAGLSHNHQVIVVTHLPQIAAFADTHFRISKQERRERTVSNIDGLDDDERVAELAAMLDGVPLSDGAIANAEAMILRARGGQATGMVRSG